jgi:hypothetical protein
MKTVSNANLPGTPQLSSITGTDPVDMINQLKSQIDALQKHITSLQQAMQTNHQGIYEDMAKGKSTFEIYRVTEPEPDTVNVGELVIEQEAGGQIELYVNVDGVMWMTALTTVDPH